MGCQRIISKGIACCFSVSSVFVIRDVRLSKASSLMDGFTSGFCVQATGSWDFTVRVWAAKEDSQFPTFRVLEGHTGNIHAVAFSKDGMLVGCLISSISGFIFCIMAHLFMVLLHFEVTHLGMVLFSDERLWQGAVFF